MKRRHVLLAGLLIACLTTAIEAQTRPSRAHSLPVVDQCPSLSSGIGADDAVGKAIEKLKSEESVQRLEAAKQLSQACDRRATDPLIDMLKDEDPSIRIAAVEALGKLGDPDSISSIALLTADPDWRVRKSLISSLTAFKDFYARNMVLNGIANPGGATITDINDMIVRCSAILTLNELKNVDFSRKAILFLKHFQESENPEIRQLADETMFALKDTRNGPAEIVGILKQMSSPDIRIWMAHWAGKIGLERARQTLTDLAAEDKNQTVRQTAADALKALDTKK
ncbi:MAG: HEAT repeat domain-containing protein [Acidobacteria bacterium]|nr:HEAT repeat domain-containing protein [Acidobacteriota bacterium]